jgi:hypothetical protein
VKTFLAAELGLFTLDDTATDRERMRIRNECWAMRVILRDRGIISKELWARIEREEVTR